MMAMYRHGKVFADVTLKKKTVYVLDHFLNTKIMHQHFFLIRAQLIGLLCTLLRWAIYR
jgi:hypothetical protein